MLNERSARDDITKFREYATTRDRRLRDELVEANLGLARTLAGRFRGGSEPFDELVQVANIGLVDAVERFDPEYGTVFSTFAVPTILGALKRHLRDHTWSLRMSRRGKELSMEVRRAMDAVQQRVRRNDPSTDDIASYTGLSRAEVRRGLLAFALHNVARHEPPEARADLAVDDEFEQVEIRDTVGSLLTRLGPLERYVVGAYYLDGRSQAVIGRELGRSQMHVWRVLERSRGEMRSMLEEAAEEEWPARRCVLACRARTCRLAS